MNTGGTDTGINVSGTEKSAFFQQVAVNAEAVSNDWNFNAYALIPVGDTEQQLNWYYQGGALNTYGLDVGYFITPELNTSVGYYYQNGDGTEADSSGVLGRIAYEVSSGLTADVNISYDEAFETRVSADLKVRFGGASTTAQRKEVQELPVINALTSTPRNREVRVHDCLLGFCLQSEKDDADNTKIEAAVKKQKSIDEKIKIKEELYRDKLCPGGSELGGALPKEVKINGKTKEICNPSLLSS